MRKSRPIRRLVDGAVDIDFYRHLAARRRRRMQRQALLTVLDATARLLRRTPTLQPVAPLQASLPK